MDIYSRHRHFILILLFLYLLLWFSVNLLILTDYPFLHTDEPWLSGLSRHMLTQGRPDVTEPFYDLYPRHPHAIKILYHSLQVLFIEFMGYSFFTVRLLSLLAGATGLALFYRLVRLFLQSENYTTGISPSLLSIAVTILLSLDSQYIYASHTARQEIFLLCLMLLSLYFLLKSGKAAAVAAGAMIGIAAGFHPNAFLIAWPASLFLLGQILLKRRPLSTGGIFLLTAAAGAGIFVLLSFLFNPSFPTDYLRYGEPLGVTAQTDLKLLRWPLFHAKLFNRISGTYYLPDIRWQYLTLPFLLLSVLPNRRFYLLIASGLIGVNTGLLLLGKYSPPSVVFLIPFYYLAAGCGLYSLSRKKIILPSLLFLFILGGTATFMYSNISRELAPSNEHYSDYLSKIREYLPEDSIVLGGLNLEYYLPDGQLFHWRNLAELPKWKDKKTPSPLEGYIREREISHIVIPEEIPFIYGSRPVWNVLYGNTAYWYPQLIVFLEEHSRKVGRFDSPGYGVRIAAYRQKKNWPVEIYEVLPEASSRE